MLDRNHLNSDRGRAGLGVKRESLREQVVNLLRWAIFTGDLPPGGTFSVPSLADEFGISPTPVREAVLDLAQHGLVVVLPNRGFRVVSPTMDYLRQAMHVRRLVEIPTMLEIARAATREDVEPLRVLAVSIIRSAQTGDLKSFVETDYEFHWRLTSLCGNSILTELIEELRSRARVVAVPAIARQGVLTDTAQEHLDLLRAIEEHDLEAVERVTLSHMDRTFEGLKAAVDGRSEAGA